MKRTLRTISLATFHGSAILSDTPFVKADEGNVGSSLQVFHNLSMFYQAMIATGLINELHDDQPYTLFAPTDDAFLRFHPSVDPFFYSAPYRPQLKALLRNHIIVGRYDLDELAANDKSPSVDKGRVPVVALDIGDYTVDSRHILSKEEVNGTIIYRIDGFLPHRKALPQFQLAKDEPPQDTLMIQQTLATYTRALDVTAAYTTALHQGLSYLIPLDRIETTTVVRRRVVEP